MTAIRMLAARSLVLGARPDRRETLAAYRATGGYTPSPADLLDLRVEVVLVEAAYVAGEETAAVRYLDGGPARPVAKPPRPFERGVGGAPTLISNVETLAQVAPASAGTSLGSGVVHVLRPGDCPVDIAADALDYLAAESSRQCGVCVSGTKSPAAAVAGLRGGTAAGPDVANIARWSTGLPGRGACGLLDAAARIAGSLLARHAGPVDAHVTGGCSTCAGSERMGGTRFAVTPPTPFEPTGGDLDSDDPGAAAAAPGLICANT